MKKQRLEELECVGLDEKSFGKGQDYVSVMFDRNPHNSAYTSIIPDSEALRLMGYDDLSPTGAALIRAEWDTIKQTLDQ